MADMRPHDAILDGETRHRPPRVVLFAARFDRVHRHCAALLDRGIEVHFVAEVERLLELASDERYGAVVAFLPLPRSPLDPLLAGARGGSSRGSRPSLVLLAQPSRLAHARDLLTRGASRVLLDTTPPEALSESVADLVRRAPRAALRVQARLEFRRPTGSTITAGQTVNLSTTGVLVRGSFSCALGTIVRVEIQVPGVRDPLTGLARLARHARPERDGLEGVAARFHAFEHDSEARLEALVSARLQSLP